MVPLSYELKSGDIVEVLTSKRERGPSRDWLALVKPTPARNKIKQWFKAESRKDTEHAGRELLQARLRKQGLPAQKIVGSPLLADVIREMGFRKADEFYIALGGEKISPEGRRREGACSGSSRARRPRASRPPPRRCLRPRRQRHQPTGSSTSTASRSRASTT